MPSLLGGTMLIQPMIIARMEPVASLAKDHPFKSLLVMQLENLNLKTRFSLPQKSQGVVFKALDMSIVGKILKIFIKRTLMSSKSIKLTFFLFTFHLLEGADH